MFIKGFSFCGLSTNQLKITLEVDQGDASKETKLPDPPLFAMTGHMMMRSSTHLHSQPASVIFPHFCRF